MILYVIKMPIRMFKSNIKGYFYQYWHNDTAYSRYYFLANDQASKKDAYSRCKKQVSAIILSRRYGFD